MSFFRRTSRDHKERKVSKADLTTIRVGSEDVAVQTLNAPREVVQAVRAYIAQIPGQISFNKGDFFYVVSRPNSDTIEIKDPVKSLRGSAPANCFKFFEKPQRTHTSTSSSSNSSSQHSSTQNGAGVGFHKSYQSTKSFHSQQSQQAQVPNPSARHASSSSGKHVSPLPSLYGIVLYDFHAERPDELSIMTGDSLILCAHHQHEWFIGKFLDKIGEPGLVPVSYVRLYDVNTKVPYNEPSQTIIDRVHLPTVEQWKMVKNRHKASARTVGPASSNPGSRVNSSGDMRAQMGRQSRQKDSLSSTASSLSQGSYIPGQNKPVANISTASASTARASLYADEVSIESFSSTNGKYWFLVRVVLSDRSTRCLCRYYEDFFNFHQQILAAWPREGGKFDTKDHKERIIPFIPGPVMDVNENLCHRRMIDFDNYLKSLRDLPVHISKSVLVNSFYDLWDGDQQLSYNDVTKNGSPIRPGRRPPNMIIMNGKGSSINGEAEHKSDQPQQYRPFSQQGNNLAMDHNGAIDIKPAQSAQNKHSSLVKRLSEMTLGHSHYHSKKRNSSGSSLGSPPQDQSPIKKEPYGLPSQKTWTKSDSGKTKTKVSKKASSNKLKLKFYYKDDIFAIAVPKTVTLEEMKHMIVPRIDECDEPNIEERLKVIPKDVDNVDQLEYLNESVLQSDSQLHENSNFTDKGKFLVIV